MNTAPDSAPPPAEDPPPRTLLYGLPPMPPPPDENPAPDPTPPPDPRTVITVRHNRRLGWWLASIGWPLWVLSSWGVFALDVEDSLLQFEMFLPIYAAILGTQLLFMGPALHYDTRTGHLWGSGWTRSGLGKWRAGDRIEYSVHFGALEILRPDGRRRRIVRGSALLNRQDWTAFVDVFLAHQNARAAAEHPAPKQSA
ncbi:hypothetical protein [Glycomyces paridis]|uniref:hypothetical protein n=1 Tax=Glycomyces paridis TaxID=2126555 RepID=UPI0018652A29|nr:hypothetical protein [Glycomyces paridis]